MDCRATVVSAGMASGMLNGNPLVPVTQLHWVVAGADLPVKLSASDPSALAVDWSVPA